MNKAALSLGHKAILWEPRGWPMAQSHDLDAPALTPVAEEAPRALRTRPRLSIRDRLLMGFVAWFLVSLILTVISVALIGQVRAKLHMVDVVDRYAFEIQQARRVERNYFLYHTNLGDALDQVHAAQRILDLDRASLATVAGARSVDEMRVRLQRYEALLAGLPALESEGATARIQEVEAQLRVHGASMVGEAQALAMRERESVERLLRMSQSVAMAMQFGMLAMIILLAVFIRRQRLLTESHELTAIGTLTAGMAHELDNPINNMMVTAAVLQESYADLDDGGRLDMVADLVRESERARAIVRNLLDFARESEVELGPLDVEEVIGETLRLASNQVKLAKVNVRQDLEENLPSVFGDRHRLTQVFLNLVLNALDAMPDGGTLTITVEKSEDPDFVNVGFTDTGMGISQQNLGRIFDPLFSTKSHSKGTGIGLSGSLGIIRQHGGDIGVTSTVGRGTTFTVSLPMARVPARRAEAVGGMR